MPQPITAYDDQGNEFSKSIRIEHRPKKTLVSLGFPMEYDLADLLPVLLRDQSRDRFYIDAGGRNHQGSGVYLDRKDFNTKIAEELTQELTR